MNVRPPFEITALARQIQGEILHVFEMPDDVALSFGAELAALAESYGDPTTVSRINWHYRVRKDLGSKGFRWRSEQDRLNFVESERQRHLAYEALMPRRPK